MFDNILQPGHLILVLVVALIVFGPDKLPGIGKTIGKAVGEFRRAANTAYGYYQEEKAELTPIISESTQEQTKSQ